jgi:hypothetical protein
VDDKVNPICRCRAIGLREVSYGGPISLQFRW